MRRRVSIFRWNEWTHPVPAVHREVVTLQPESTDDDSGIVTRTSEAAKPPLLFVPGYGHGAWVFAEAWLDSAAGRGYPAYAMSLRGHGFSASAPHTTLRAYAHDVVQVAARLPRQSVLIGHGVGGLAVAEALSRYPARAAVLVAPVFGGLGTALAALLRNPFGTLPAVFGAAIRLRRRQLFSRELGSSTARDHLSRLDRPSAPRVGFQLVMRHTPEPAVGAPPVLVVGSPDDRVVSRRSLNRAAQLYGGAPLLFPGMGHDLMLDARWQEPIDAILDWLEKPATP